MPKSNYVKEAEEAFGAQLQTFKNGIGGYATVLSLSPATISAQAADADYYNYVLTCQNTTRNNAQQWTSWKQLTRNGGQVPASGMPAAPALPASAPVVEPGVEPRFRSLVKQIKASAAYNQSIGEALGIEGPEQTGPDMAAVQPDLTATVRGTTVMVGWGWGGDASFLDLCEIEVDRADSKGFVLLCYDSTPGYIDTATFPASPTKWTYRAIYRVGDQRVGQWSKPVTVTVAG